MFFYHNIIVESQTVFIRENTFFMRVKICSYCITSGQIISFSLSGIKIKCCFQKITPIMFHNCTYSKDHCNIVRKPLQVRVEQSGSFVRKPEPSQRKKIVELDQTFDQNGSTSSIVRLPIGNNYYKGV